MLKLSDPSKLEPNIKLHTHTHTRSQNQLQEDKKSMYKEQPLKGLEDKI